MWREKYCKGCRFIDSDGECRKFPPTVTHHLNEDFEYYPRVRRFENAKGLNEYKYQVACSYYEETK